MENKKIIAIILSLIYPIYINSGIVLAQNTNSVTNLVTLQAKMESTNITKQENSKITIHTNKDKKITSIIVETDD